jgi:hypothetical protein
MYGERWRYREGSGTGARDAQSESLSFAQSCRYHKVGKMKVNQKPGSAPPWGGAYIPNHINALA